MRPKKLQRTGTGGELWWKPYSSQGAKRITPSKLSPNCSQEGYCESELLCLRTSAAIK